ncbi:Sorting nexin mvp1 [Tulasnella sp. 417]|nr:Sorting nexin mvp1 [Tulasnella sp. 417]
MFNNPRPNQFRYNSGNANGLASSFVSDNPLTASIYSDDGGLDPWSTSPTTPLPPPPAELPGGLSRIIADAIVPPIYNEALAAVEPNFAGETSLTSLSRVLSTSGLGAATVDRIINLVSSKSRVSKLEFFVALALVALAQQGRDPSIEQVVSVAQQSQTLPSPMLNLQRLTTAAPTNGHESRLNGYSTVTNGHSAAPSSPAPAYAENDPWSSNYRPSFNPGSTAGAGLTAAGEGGQTIMGGLPHNWWNKLEKVTITIFPEKQGFILNRYTVYMVQPERGPAVQRRYSEFVFLWDCLVKRYPFRILPALPPKRIGGDAGFLEQRRRGLARWINFVVNHPILAADGVLLAFLTEPSFEAWKKHSSAISYDEESVSKRVDRVEEMSIPADLDEKMNVLRNKLPDLIEQWTRICAIAERIWRRREAVAADMSRLNLSLSALTEQNHACWHQPDAQEGSCDLFDGVRLGMIKFSSRLRNQSDIIDQRAQAVLSTSLEQLKAQRDLYIATRDLFARHTRLSPDRADMLRKRVEQNGRRLEQVKATQKEGWQAEVDKITNAIERDQVDIQTCMARRVFIRHSMWHELRVVLHNRENALVTQTIQTFVAQERDFERTVITNWEATVLDVENMPYE